MTITRVTVSKDLRYAKVFYMVHGEESREHTVQRLLRDSAGYLQGVVARGLGMRFAPRLSFHLDEATERGIRMSAMIDKVRAEDAEVVGESKDCEETEPIS